jgi:hypothetical protein
MSYISAPDPSMTPKEEEEYLLLYGPRKERKALKKRRKAREQERAKKQPARKPHETQELRESQAKELGI